MPEQFGKPETPEIKPVEPTVEELEKGKEALVDVLQASTVASGKSLRQIARELSGLMGKSIPWNTVERWHYRINPALPKKNNLAAMAEVYGVSLEKITDAINTVRRARDILNQIRNPAELKRKISRDYEGYGEAGSGRVRSSKRPKAK